MLKTTACPQVNQYQRFASGQLPDSGLPLHIGNISDVSRRPLCWLTDGALQFLNIQINNITGEIPSCLFQKGAS